MKFQNIFPVCHCAHTIFSSVSLHKNNKQRFNLNYTVPALWVKSDPHSLPHSLQRLKYKYQSIPPPPPPHNSLNRPPHPASTRGHHTHTTLFHHHMWTFKLQALVYNILPSTTAVFSYATGSRKLSANEQFFVGAQTVESLLQTTQIMSDVCFITDHVAYTSSNKTKII